MPWMVVAFGLMVVPAGIVSIILIILQPVIVGHFCGWCLLTALCMLFMIALTVDEVLAVGQYLKWARRQNQPFWHTFWQGGRAEVMPRVETPHVKGLNFPWNLILSFVLGVGLLFAGQPIFGGLIATTSLLACSEVLRALRFLNIFWALLLFFTLTWKIVFLALVTAALSIPRGKIDQIYGNWKIN